MNGEPWSRSIPCAGSARTIGEWTEGLPVLDTLVQLVSRTILRGPRPILLDTFSGSPDVRQLPSAHQAHTAKGLLFCPTHATFTRRKHPTQRTICSNQAKAAISAQAMRSCRRRHGDQRGRRRIRKGPYHRRVGHYAKPLVFRLSLCRRPGDAGLPRPGRHVADHRLLAWLVGFTGQRPRCRRWR